MSHKKKDTTDAGTCLHECPMCDRKWTHGSEVDNWCSDDDPCGPCAIESERNGPYADLPPREWFYTGEHFVDEFLDYARKVRGTK